jgi:hypothetical protein
MKIIFQSLFLGFVAMVGVVALSTSAQAGVHVGIGIGPTWGGYHGGYHGYHGGYYGSRHGYGYNPYRSYYYGPSVSFYSEPEYVYVEPAPIVVQSAPAEPRYTTAQAPEPLPPRQSAPPAYGGRIGNTDEVKSPFSEFRLKTRAARNTVVYDAYTGQAFRIP